MNGDFLLGPISPKRCFCFFSSIRGFVTMRPTWWLLLLQRKTGLKSQ